MRCTTRAVAVVAAAFLMLTVVEFAGASAKKGKIHVCYATKGADKGAMRFARGKKCRKGEKSLSWNKKGKPGAAGPSGQAGPMGPVGPAGPAGGSAQDTVDQLRSQVEQQSARITALESQVTQLTGQVTGMGTELSALETVTCDQLGDLTDQSNAMGTALGGIALTGVLGGLTFTNPGAPTALPSFSC